MIPCQRALLVMVWLSLHNNLIYTTAITIQYTFMATIQSI